MKCLHRGGLHDHVYGCFSFVTVKREKEMLPPLTFSAPPSTLHLPPVTKHFFYSFHIYFTQFYYFKKPPVFFYLIIWTNFNILVQSHFS